MYRSCSRRDLRLDSRARVIRQFGRRLQSRWRHSATRSRKRKHRRLPQREWTQRRQPIGSGRKRLPDRVHAIRFRHHIGQWGGCIECQRRRARGRSTDRRQLRRLRCFRRHDPGTGRKQNPGRSGDGRTYRWEPRSYHRRRQSFHIDRHHPASHFFRKFKLPGSDIRLQ